MFRVTHHKLIFQTLCAVSLLAVSCINLSTARAGQAPSATPLTTLTIHGKVLQDPGDQPVRKATIHLNPGGGPNPSDYSAITDAEGQFTIDDVQPGRYAVRIEHPGFIQSAVGRSAYISVQRDTAKTSFVFRMQPAAVFVGKIVDADGDPVRNVSVTAQRIGSSPGSLPLDNLGNGSTNDLGEFRISGLRPGRYKISATPPQGTRPAHPAKPANDSDQTIYTTTYYPGTLSEGQAIPFELHSGDETHVNFGVLTTRAFRVSGSITGIPTGAAMSQLMLEVRGPGGSQVVPQDLAKDGRFEFVNVLPGSYTPILLVVSFSSPQPSMQMLHVGQPIEVTHANVDDLHLQPEPGGQVHGRFRLDTGQKFDWTQLNVILAPLDDHNAGIIAQGPMGASATPSVNADSTFDLKSVPGGTYQIIVGARSDNLRDYFTKSINLDGRDVSDSGIQVRADTYLDIVVSANGASIAGTVVDAKGQPVRDASVVDIPSDDHRYRLDLYQRDTTDASGHFNLRGLNPGKYTVLAFEDLQEDFRQPDFRKAHKSQGESVQLEEGAHKTVVLTLIRSDQ